VWKRVAGNVEKRGRAGRRENGQEMPPGVMLVFPTRLGLEYLERQLQF
jgi:hypothetical protein